jgi:hypothetical protein
MGNNAPDVRYRLSAEGVAEVVAAFKRVQAEAEKSGKSSASGAFGLSKLTDAFGGLKKIIPTISLAAVVTGFIALTKHAFETAVALGHMNERTGLSVETLSVISFAAQKTGSDIEVLEKGFIKFDKAMNDLDSGAKTAKDAVAQLFGNSKALNGLDTDQRFRKVVDALAKMEPSYQRTALAQEYFGKGGAQLLPIIDKLGGEGFEKLRKQAEALGLTFDRDFVKAALQTKASMKQLKLQAEGLATQFITGLTPALGDAATALVKATSGDGVNGFKKVGEIAGTVVKEIVALFIIVGKTIGFVMNEAELAWDHFKKYAIESLDVIAKSVKKHPILFALSPAAAIAKTASESKPGENGMLDRLRVLQAEIEKALVDAFTPGKQPKLEEEPKIKPKPTVDEGLIERQRKAALELAEARQDYAARLAAAELKDQEAAEKEKYEKGLESLREYYANRIAMAEKQGRAETDALYAKVLEFQKAPLGKDELKAEREAKIVKAAADFQTKVLENEATIKSLRAEEAKETEDLQQKSLEFEKKIQKVQGDRFAAARADIAAQAAAWDKLLIGLGVSASERSRLIGAFVATGNQKIDFEELQHKATMAMDELERKRQQIDLQVQSGQIFAYEGEQKIMDLERDRLPQLQQIADAMRESAVTPEQIQSAQEFQTRIDQLAVSSDKAAKEMAAFKQNVEGALTSDLSNWLSSGIDQAENFADAFRGLAASVVQSLRQIAAQWLAMQMIQKMLGFLGGVAAPSGPAPGSPGAPAMMATGGLVRGPGTGVSDSIAARLSNFEYVVRAAVVKQPGVLNLLNTLNYGTPQVRRRTTPRFADGGLVDAKASGSGKASLTATLALDEGLLLKRLEASPDFNRLYVKTAQNNQKAMKSALGG